MKIALIDPVGGKMGMNHYDDGLMGALCEKQFQTFILSNYKSRFENVYSNIFFDNKNKNRFLSAWYSFFGMIRSVSFCRKEKIDWVIFHVFRGGLFDLFSLLLLKICGQKILLIVHDIETIDTNTNTFIKRFVLTSFHNEIVVHNQFSLEKLKEFTGRASVNNIHIIPHGNYSHIKKNIHSREDALKYFQLDPSGRYFLFFGQIKKTKGLQLLLDAMHHSKSNFKLIIAGKLRIKNFDVYGNVIDRYNLNDRVIKMLRFITDEESDKLFCLSDAVVLPYQNIYQSGVLLLTMTYGKTVIASDLDPFKEIIHHGSNGLLFKKNNAHSLAMVIDDLISEKYDIHQMEINAKEFAEKSFSWEKIAATFSLIFRSI